MSSNFRRLLVSVALVALAGCEGASSRPDEFHVSGQVHFSGQPVPGGMIMFEPDIKGGNDGLQGYAEIENGYYDTKTTTKGVTGGSYVVKINGFDRPAIAGQAPRPKLLFKNYTVRVDLNDSGELYDFDIPASAGSTTAVEPPPPT